MLTRLRRRDTPLKSDYERSESKDLRGIPTSRNARQAVAKQGKGDKTFNRVARSVVAQEALRFRDTFQVGAGDGTRTRDSLLGKQELYQLSYSRIILMINFFVNGKKETFHNAYFLFESVSVCTTVYSGKKGGGFVESRAS
jgi:hypothetical protein